jgi:serine protease Do
MAGEVIGITSIKISEVGVEGTGYAISSNEAMPIIQELISKGYVSRAYLGVSTYTVDNYAIARFALKVDKGVLLTYVEPGSPATKAGLQAGDVVVQFNGKEVLTGSELIRAIHQTQIGSEVEIVYWRAANQSTTKAVLIEKQR